MLIDEVEMNEVRDTNRLVIENLRASHAVELYPLLQDPELYHYIPGKPPTTMEEVEKRFTLLSSGSTKPDEVWLNWVARRQGKVVATLQSTLFADGLALVGYVVFRPFWNTGVGSQGVRWILGEIFSRHGAERAHADIDPRNTWSIRLVERIGMREILPATERDPAADREFELSRMEWLAIENPRPAVSSPR